MFHTFEPSWPRHEHFRHYMDNTRCTYSLTVQIDVTPLRAALKARGLKAYPAQIFMLATVVNALPPFRMALSEDGRPGYWDISHPSYTIFNEKSSTFSSIWTPFDRDFSAFYTAASHDIESFSGTNAFAPKDNEPQNVFFVSSVPWVDFTAFNLNIYGEGTHLAPIFTLGRYIEQEGKTLLPLAMQLHHSACDGFHAEQFAQMLRTMAQDCSRWL